MTIKTEVRKYTDKDGLQQVRIVVSEKGKRVYIPTKVFVDAKNWDAKKQQVKTSDASHRILNQTIMIKLADVKKQVALEGIPEMKRRVDTDLHPFIAAMARKLSERNASETVGVFLSQARKIKTYAPNAKLQDITPTFLEEYETYCRNVLGNGDGGVSGTLQFVIQVVNRGINKGILPAHQLAEFEEKTYRPGEKSYLTRDEMDKWEAMLDRPDLTVKENLVAHYFMLSCYTALRYRDCTKINPKLKVNGRLVLYTNKTGTPVSLKMSEKVEKLVDRCLQLGKLIPNNKANPLLEKLAVKVGLDKHISFHSARHTFGVECARLGIRIEICSKLMGHTNIKTTAIYYQLVNPVLDEAMETWG